ncbi:MAG: ABC transporter permease [Catenulispora sp. 13_1_20CM_3_70_7]|nr:ABC transporter permease [Catenulisporales bacterium]OLE26050.1 MAG: ABC transporter permease [Catenulispora sp. 13_1_20CM_3_70_7]
MTTAPPELDRAPMVGDPPSGHGVRVRVRYGRPARWAVRIASLVTAVLLWQLLTTRQVSLWIRFGNLPSATAVASAFWHQLHTGQYYRDLAASVLRIVLGFCIAGILGVAAGVAVARSRVAEDLLKPVLEVVRPIPAIALVPVAILAFPSDEQGMVAITGAAAFFPIFVSTRHAVRALPTTAEEAVRTLGAGRWTVLRRVVLPGALPGISGGLSVGIGVAWICVVSAEMISGQYGVGYRTWQAYTVIDYPGVVVGMLTIGLLGGITSGAVELAGRRVTRWLPREDGAHR